jgi:hypothetical protein
VTAPAETGQLAGGTSEFLSLAWIDGARQIRDMYRHLAAAALSDAPEGASTRLNVTVTGVPGQAQPLLGHLEFSAQLVDIEEGHLEDAHAALTFGYDTARDVLLGEDVVQEGLAAMVDGRMIVDGPMSKVIALGGILSTGGAALAADATLRLRAITSPGGTHD